MTLPNCSWPAPDVDPAELGAARTFTARDLLGANPNPFVEGMEMWVPSSVREPDTVPVFSGIYESRRLSCGATIQISDGTTICDSYFAGTLKRSLTLVLSVSGTPFDLAVGEASGVTLHRGQAVLLTLHDAKTIAGSHRKGESTRSLMLQTRPEDVTDPNLAALVDQAIATTAVTRLPADRWVWAMADRAFSRGAVSRLVEESCALGLLADALQALTGDGRASAGSAAVGAGDRRKMLRVRDRLLAELDHEHRLADLAREAGLSVTTLKTKFTAVFGQPVFAYLRDLRLERARSGIEREGWSASQAAYSVGYRNAGGFTGAFRRKFGMLPSDLSRSAKTRAST